MEKSQELQKTLQEEKKEIFNSIQEYATTNLLSVETLKSFEVEQTKKMAILQYTPVSLRKNRVCWRYKDNNGLWQDNIIEYIPVRKLERLLNFLFNFQWSSQVIKEEFIETDTTTKQGKDTKVYEAFVIMRFTGIFLGKEINREVSGSFKMYSNDAVSRFAVIQASISQAKRNFAKEFGIWADLNDEDVKTERENFKNKGLADTESVQGNIINDFNK